MHTHIHHTFGKFMKETSVPQVKEYLLELQNKVRDLILQEDPDVNFREDEWDRPEGGGGRTRAFEAGKLFEKAGVNFSHVWGNQLPAAATNLRPELKDCEFEAMGISLIIHPLNPFVPT